LRNEPVAETKDRPQEPSQPTFEQALQELEQIVRELEEGDVSLNDALGRYEKGVKLLRQCHDLLEKAERRIELLSGLDPNGNPVTTPLSDDSLTLDQKARRRGQRRSSPGGEAPAPDENDVDSSGGLF
jgi:exodeoxyribonuclease VII small subunit